MEESAVKRCLEGNNNLDILVSIIIKLDFEDILNVKRVNRKFQKAAERRFTVLVTLKKLNNRYLQDTGILELHDPERELWAEKTVDRLEETEQKKHRKMIQAGLNYNFKKSKTGYAILEKANLFARGWFVNGKLDGLGVIIDKVAKRVVEGEFKEGKPTGKMMIKDEKMTYIGGLKDWKESDYGIKTVITTSDKSYTYTGNFLKGRFNGMGRYDCESFTYEGFFLNGLRSGTGFCSKKNGDYMDGIWGEGKFINGKAKIGNRVFEGDFKDNIFTGEVRNSNKLIESKEINGFQTVRGSKGEIVKSFFVNGKAQGSSVVWKEGKVVTVTEMENNKSEGITIVKGKDNRLLICESTGGSVVAKKGEVKSEELVQAFDKGDLTISIEAKQNSVTWVKGTEEGWTLLYIGKKEEEMVDSDSNVVGGGDFVDLRGEKLYRTFILSRDLRKCFKSRVSSRMEVMKENGVRFFNTASVPELKEMSKEPHSQATSESALCVGDILNLWKIRQMVGMENGIKVSRIIKRKATVFLFGKSRRDRKKEAQEKAPKTRYDLPGAAFQTSNKVFLAKSQLGEENKGELIKDGNRKINKGMTIEEYLNNKGEGMEEEIRIVDPSNLLDPLSKDLRFLARGNRGNQVKQGGTQIKKEGIDIVEYIDDNDSEETISDEEVDPKSQEKEGKRGGNFIDLTGEIEEREENKMRDEEETDEEYPEGERELDFEGEKKSVKRKDVENMELTDNEKWFESVQIDTVQNLTSDNIKNDKKRRKIKCVKNQVEIVNIK